VIRHIRILEHLPGWPRGTGAGPGKCPAHRPCPALSDVGARSEGAGIAGPLAAVSSASTAVRSTERSRAAQRRAERGRRAAGGGRPPTPHQIGYTAKLLERRGPASDRRPPASMGGTLRQSAGPVADVGRPGPLAGVPVHAVGVVRAMHVADRVLHGVVDLLPHPRRPAALVCDDGADRRTGRPCDAWSQDGVMLLGACKCGRPSEGSAPSSRVAKAKKNRNAENRGRLVDR
jgi:hypothetical protein